MKYFSLIILAWIVATSQAQKPQLTNIYFETNKWQPSTIQLLRLDSLISILIQKQVTKISVNGHTDFIGDSLFNINLSNKRCNSVSDYVKRKIQNIEIVSSYFGKKRPVKDNNDIKERVFNRRVEILFENETYAEKSNLSVKSLDELFSLIIPGQQEFCINPYRDTILQGKEGTIICIRANSFTVSKNLKKCITIVLKERNKISDIIRENLSTSTFSNQIIISQSMFFIDAKIGSASVELQKDLLILTPSDTVISDMKSWFGTRDEDSHMKWEMTNETVDTISGITLQNYFSGLTILDSVVYDTVMAKCPNVTCRILNFLRIKKFKPIIDSMMVRRKIQNSSPDSKNILDTLSVDELKKLSNNDLKYYVFNTNRLGWRNMDWFMKIPNNERIDYKVHCMPEKNLDVKLIFKLYRSVLPLVSYSKGYHYSGVPEKYKAWILAFKIIRDKPFMAIENIVTDKKGLDDLTFKEVTIEEIYEKLKVFDGNK